MNPSITPTVFIGVGSWGGAILSDLRTQLVGAHGGLDQTPIFGWLRLDFKDQRDNLTGWADTERLALDFEGQEALAPWYQRSAPVHGALHQSLTDPLLSGAEQTRGRARFGLLRNWGDIEVQLRNVLQNVTLAESHEKSALVLGAVANALNVFIVADFGDATGGGVANDLAFAVRSLLETRHQGLVTTRVLGVLALPDATGSRRSLANAYASLRELHHWNDGATPFEAQAAQRDFLGGAEKTVFDLAYLWGTGNASGYHLSPENLRRAVAQWLALDLNPAIAPHRTVERNLVLGAKPFDEWGQSTRYFAAGVASLEFPGEALAVAVAANLAAQAWRKNFFPPVRHTSGEFNAVVLEWMRQNHLDVDTLLADLFEVPQLDAPYRVGDLAETVRANWSGNLRLLKNGRPETIQDQVDLFYGEMVQPLVSRDHQLQVPLETPLPQGEGNLAREVRGRFEQIGEFWRRAAIEFSIQHAVDAEWGVTVTQELVKVATERLETQEARLIQAIEGVTALIGEQRSFLQNCFAQLAFGGLKKHAGFLGNGIRRQQDGLVEQFVAAGASLGTLTLEWQALLWLRSALTDAREIWARPQADLKTFLDRAQEGERLLRKKESDSQSAPVVIGQLVLDSGHSQNVKEASHFYAQKLAQGQNFDLWKEVEQPEDSPLRNGAFVALMTRQEGALGEALHNRALQRTRPFLARISALDLFDELHLNQALANNRLQELFRAADAYFPLSLSRVTPGWDVHSRVQTRRAAFRNAQHAIARTPSEEQFATVLRGLGFSQNEGSNDLMLEINDKTRVVFWSELGGFPLRSASDYLSDLKAAYQRELGDPLSQPLHSREDVTFWLPIDTPSPEHQEHLWEKLMIGIALGVVQTKLAPVSANAALEVEFTLRSEDGTTQLVLGNGLDPTAVTTPVLHGWRRVVLSVEEQSGEGVLDFRLLQASKLEPVELVEKLKFFLGTLMPGTFRSQVSEIFSEWREQVFAPRRGDIERQLSIISTVLADDSRGHLHFEAGKKKALLEMELALLEGETEKQGPPADAAAELERLLSL